jgi:site-specific recombinase XerC
MLLGSALALAGARHELGGGRLPAEMQVKALVGVTNGRTFEDKRDAAIIRICLDTGLRLAELASLRYDPRDDQRSDVDLELHRLRVVGKGPARTARRHHLQNCCGR